MNETGSTAQPRIVEFGPHRVMGLSYVGKNEHGEVMALWHDFIARVGEIGTPDTPDFFGLCRCLPGATDGSFEYLAAVTAMPDATVPDSMVEAPVAAGTYAVFSVESLAEIRQAWTASGEWLGSNSEWTGYCDGKGCGCANHPSFELYPPEFPTDGRLFIYMPIRPKG